MEVILPQNNSGVKKSSPAAGKGGFPLLYLLHGIGDDDTAWLRMSSIERYAEELGLAIVMPKACRSYYADMVYGYNYWTFLTAELPAAAHEFFPLTLAREKTFVAGLSMGGYGALKWALQKPEMFAAVASLSGGLNRARFRMDPERCRDYFLAFGDRDITGTEDDVYWLLKKVDESDDPKPQIYQCCGTEDPFYSDNILFRNLCSNSSFSFKYEEGPGTHNWDYWDKKIKDVLNWLPL